MTDDKDLALKAPQNASTDTHVKPKASSRKASTKKTPPEDAPKKRKKLDDDRASIARVTPADKRSGVSFQALRHALQPVMKHAAPKGMTGHYLQLLTLWPELTHNSTAQGSVLHKLAFPRGMQQGAVLHLYVRDSSQALLLSYEKTNLCTKINQAFGFALVNDIKVMAAPTSSKRT
jgi:hypothetical protein